MYKNYHLLILLLIIFISCNTTGNQLILVSVNEELSKAISEAEGGDEIILANGTWKDVQLKINSVGTGKNPIIIRAEDPGKVIIEGESYIHLGGNFIEVHGLYFKNGYTPEGAIFKFRTGPGKVANHCRVSNCVIENFNQTRRDKPDHWVEFWGRHNQLDHCYLAGKSNQGPTIRVEIKGNENIRNYHQIVNNHFGPRPRKGGPKAETIQIGDSETSMSPCNTTVANNLFEKCDGEVEVISSKTNFNEFRNNVFYMCEGSLVMRHGNYCIIDGNYFIGDAESENIGGIRIINTGHWVTNNYFFNLKGKEFRSPIAIMNGIPKSPLNRYNQVTDVVVAHNTWINCSSPWQFGVGTNISQREVLPLSEIRSARPIRTVFANNLIHNDKTDESPIVAHDQVDGVVFKNNYINNNGVEYNQYEGLQSFNFEIEKISDNLYAPSKEITSLEVYNGFDFQSIQYDIVGEKRTTQNFAGALSPGYSIDPSILDKSKYGANWYTNENPDISPTIHKIDEYSQGIIGIIEQATEGDIIELVSGKYEFNTSIVIDKNITIRSADLNNKTEIIYSGAEGSPAFLMQPRADLVLIGVRLKGTDVQHAFATLKTNMSSMYKLKVSDCEITGFDYVLKAYKESFADSITFSGTTLKDCKNGIELSEETNDKGDYNTEYLTIQNCQFDNIDANVIDYYRGGYDESTIGGNLMVSNCSFTNCGKNEANNIFLNTRGIVNVNITKNTFNNNPVKLIALLWGAKNNNHSNNQIINSGEIIIEENLKLKLVY